ncbi:MAG: hypothetical protein LAN18_08550 [Acidobacteriia bacterium]|nr:hypothetical protein [Terriglobia bacterium]
MNMLLAIVANIVLVVSALGFGSLVHRLFLRSFSQLDRLALTLLAGLGLLGTILFCVGQVWFSRSAILLVLLSGVLLAFGSLASAGQECWSALGRVHLPVFPAAIIFSVLLVTAVGGLALPTGDLSTNDTIAYHYLGPKVWLREGVIRPVPDEVLTYFPVVVETQYAALMSVGGKRAPGFFAVVSLASVLLIAASLAIRLGLDPSGAWWAAALIAAMPAVYRGAYGGMLDALFAGFVLAAARMAFDAEQPGHYALFGIFCGISMGTKYTGIIAWALLIFCSFLFSVWVCRRQLTTILKSLGISCAVAIAIASPFYLRNWIFYDCPIYPPSPFLLHFFTSKNMLPAVMQGLLENMGRSGQGMGGGFVDFLLLPFNLTYHTANYIGGAGGIGLVPWALGPFGLIARRRDAFTKGMLLFAVLQVAAWFVTAQVSRYVIHIYVIGAIFGVLGWQYTARSVSRNARVLSAVVIAISILYGMFMISSDRVEDVHAALSSSFEAKRSFQETPHLASFDYINSEPSVRKVLILNKGIAAYFIDKPYIKPFGRWGEQTLPGATDVPKVMAQLASLHVTHILDVKSEDGSFQLPEHPSGLTLVFEQGDQRVYRVD